MGAWEAIDVKPNEPVEKPCRAKRAGGRKRGTHRGSDERFALAQSN